MVLFASVFASCNILDVKPYQSIDYNYAITSKKDLTIAINGLYSAFQSSGYYGREFILACDLYADNLRWTGTTVDYNQFFTNNLSANNSIIESIWASIFDAINRANIVLKKTDDIKDLSADESKQYKAEVLFLRSLAYFDLLRMFGGIPLRLEPTTDYTNVAKEKSTVEAVYKQIITDLRYSSQYAKDFSSSVYASKLSSQALLSKVYLYRYYISNNTSDLDSAVYFASGVISTMNIALPPYSSVFTANLSSESIFEIDFNELDNNRLAQYLGPISLAGRNEVRPTDALIGDFSASDTRKPLTILSASDGFYAGKYTDIAKGTDNVYVLRLAEMYLIRAEANTRLQKQIPDIVADIQIITDRAGISLPTFSTYQEIIDEIEFELRLEFAFEAHRWFDLVRLNKVTDFKPNVTDPNKYMFPIPLSEIQANNLCTQNNGY